MADFVLTPIERRVLNYLDQHGATHRHKILVDLASPGSKIGRLGGRTNGSNGAAPLIVGKWCKRLRKAGLIAVNDTRDGFYRDHDITAAGRKFIRSEPSHV